MTEIISARQQGVSAGQKHEPTPPGFQTWPAPAQAAYFEGYADGREQRLKKQLSDKLAAVASRGKVKTFADRAA